MDDKTTENTSKNSLYAIKPAVSLMVLGAAQIKYVGWEEDAEAKSQMLYAKLREVEEGWRSQRTLAGILELINNVFCNEKNNYSDLYRKGFEGKIESIFKADLCSCHKELKESISRIFTENKRSNPYHKALEDSIESIFSKYNDLDSCHRKNLKYHIDLTINTVIDDPDLYCQELMARIDYLLRENIKKDNSYRQKLKNNIGRIFRIDIDNDLDSYRYELKDKNLDSCRQELKDSITRIFNEIKESDPYRKGLEDSIENIFSKSAYEGLGSYRKALEFRIDRIFSNDNDLASYRYELEDSLEDIFIVKPFAITKPFYEIYYNLEHYYKSIKKMLLKAEVDKFDIFVFPADYFKSDIPKEIIQVRHGGITEWLKRGFDEEIHDKFFNPAKPETEIIDAPANSLPIPTIPVAADDSKDEPTKKNRNSHSEREPAPESVVYKKSKKLKITDEQIKILNNIPEPRQREAVRWSMSYHPNSNVKIGKVMGISSEAVRMLRKRAESEKK